MSIKILNEKTAIIVLAIVILAMVLFLVGSTAKMSLLLKENKELASVNNALNAKVLGLSKKLEGCMADSKKQIVQLEKARNKLTQERLENAQLKQAVEELKVELSPETVPTE